MMCWIVCSLSFVGCASLAPEPQILVDSVQCTTDCVSVTKGFVYQRFVLEEQLIRCQARAKEKGL